MPQSKSADAARNKLVAIPRTSFGKGAARTIRREHNIPAVMYGHGTDPVHISLPGHQTMLALKVANVLLTIEIDGKKYVWWTYNTSIPGGAGFQGEGLGWKNGLYKGMKIILGGEDSGHIGADLLGFSWIWSMRPNELALMPSSQVLITWANHRLCTASRKERAGNSGAWLTALRMACRSPRRAGSVQFSNSWLALAA